MNDETSQSLVKLVRKLVTGWKAEGEGALGCEKEGFLGFCKLFICSVCVGSPDSESDTVHAVCADCTTEHGTKNRTTI